MNKVEINKELSNKSIESYKNLRTNLIYMAKAKVIGLTSTVPNEGKTITAFQLALSFADLGKKTIFVDCDLRRSSLKDYLMIAGNSSGLSEYLSDQSRELIYRSNIDNLDVIFTGKFPPNPTELLFSDKFGELINELRKHYDYVIVDTPPITGGPDSIIVGRHCDGIVLVIKSHSTKRKLLMRAKQELERNGVKILGSVLNGVKESDMSSYYYQYYKD